MNNANAYIHFFLDSFPTGIYHHYGQQYGGSLRKLKIELPHDIAIPLWGHISGKNHCSKGHMHPSIHCSTVHNSQDMEATQMSIDRWMDIKDVSRIYNGIVIQS